ncbi:hypothetical protein V6N12_007773 [Hibiscus sabdariffa]|uniref:Transmembrane protein n=1 Tax=Hibiscus sabdariffa TaxID=183260 RepID=A0ABR2F2R1_9ROSI
MGVGCHWMECWLSWVVGEDFVVVVGQWGELVRGGVGVAEKGLVEVLRMVVMRGSGCVELRRFRGGLSRAASWSVLVTVVLGCRVAGYGCWLSSGGVLGVVDCREDFVVVVGRWGELVRGGVGVAEKGLVEVLRMTVMRGSGCVELRRFRGCVGGCHCRLVVGVMGTAVVAAVRHFCCRHCLQGVMEP